MMELASFQPSFLAPTESASILTLTTPVKMYFCKLPKNFKLKLCQNCAIDRLRPFYFFLALLELRAKSEVPLYHPETGSLHYTRLFEMLLQQTLEAFVSLECEGKLPPNTSLGMNKFIPCLICKMQNTHCKPCITTATKNGLVNSALKKWNEDCPECMVIQSKINVYTPITHCENCIPTVTHTKQGICVLVRGHGKILIMDLIPVLPSPQDVKTEPLMKLYKMITTSLLKEKPPGRKKAYNAYFSKDKVVPEEMHQLSQVNPEGQENTESRYILVKIISYGPEPNFQIRATQSVNAIAKFTGERVNALTYQYVKTLGKLVEVEDLGGYMLKKVYLSPTNYMRTQGIITTNRIHERCNLWTTVTSQEIIPFFQSKVNFEDGNFADSIVNKGIIPLKLKWID